MQKYLLTAFYFLVMLAILVHPVTLSNNKDIFPISKTRLKPFQKGEEINGSKTQNAAFYKKNRSTKQKNSRSKME